MNWQNRKAILYKRISDDDQSNYSIADQDERLIRFCEIWKIRVVANFTDDGYSAKNFDRPGYKNIWSQVKGNKNLSDLILFTNWSRFSRAEMGETFMEIYRFQKAGIEVQAIEQPLDLNIPENHLLLAIYIASPMVDNLRRASNTINGIRKSNKEGRYCGLAPFGYLNTRDERNLPRLNVDALKSQIIEGIFLDYLKRDDPKLIIKRAREQGLTVRGHSVFQKIITNPLYAGLIKVKAYRDEQEQIIKAVHEPIVSEEIYWAVVQKYKVDTTPKPKIYSESLHLRGLVRCESCDHPLTGGRSRGRHGGYYDYYRCLRCNNQNSRAEVAHKQLSQILQAISLKPEFIHRFIHHFENKLKIYIAGNTENTIRLRREIESLEANLQSLESKYIENRVTFDTYDKHYPLLRSEIATKRLKLDEINTGKSNMLELLRVALPKMMNLDTLYNGLPVDLKHELIRLMFQSGLYKTKSGYRTPSLLDLFDQKAAMEAGLVIAETLTKSIITMEKDKLCTVGEGTRNGIEPLLRFILRVAA